jgi:predicted PurR-regulated permease PerM
MSSPALADRPETAASKSGTSPPPPQAAEAVDLERARTVETGLRRAASVAVIGIFVILFGAFLQAGRVFLLPIASAIVIGTMLSPLARRAEQLRISPVISATFALVFFIALIQFALAAVVAPLVSVLSHAPDLGETIRSKLEVMDPLIGTLRNLQETLAPGSGDASGSIMRLDLGALVQPVIGYLTPAAGELVVFLATLFLYLISRIDVRRNLILMSSTSDARLRAIRLLNEIEENLVRYIGTVTIINVVLGTLTALGTFALGYPNPLLLGVLEFVCAFVPYLGAAFMTLVLLGVGVLSFPTWHQPLIGTALFVAMVTSEGQFITPHIVGARFTMSPLAVFVTLAFWTWLWGPVGTFLSVPFLLIGTAAIRHFFQDEDPELPG